MIDARTRRVLVSIAVLVLLLLSGGMLRADQDCVPVLLSEMPAGERVLVDGGDAIVNRPEPAVASVLVRRPVSRGPPA